MYVQVYIPTVFTYMNIYKSSMYIHIDFTWISEKQGKAQASNYKCRENTYRY